jgi:hypothetical protein
MGSLLNWYIKGEEGGDPGNPPPPSPAGRRCHATFNYRAFSSPHNSANSLSRQGERGREKKEEDAVRYVKRKEDRGK